MRNAFADEITALAQADPRVVLLSGDIGNRMFDRFKAHAPARFINAGVAEANMIGVAAGLAMAGLRPVAYTIAPFITARCLEQIRIDLCYHRLPVVIVGVGAGLCYAELGATHQAMEDIAQMRTLPDMTVLCPGDAHEVRGGMRAALAHDGPVYLRLGKKGEPLVHARMPAFEIGRPITVRPGSDAAVLATGNMLPVAVQAADLLADRGIELEVVSFHTVKPLNESVLANVFRRFSFVATLEEHSCLGGLGGAVAEWLCDQSSSDSHGRLLRIGAEDRFVCEAGDQEHYRALFGLTPRAIADRIGGFLESCAPQGAGRLAQGAPT